MTVMAEQMGVAIRLRALDAYVDSLLVKAQAAEGEERLELIAELVGAVHARRELQGEVA